MNETLYPNFTWTDIENPTVADFAAIQNRVEIDTHYPEDALEQGHLPKIEKSANTPFIILRAYTARENEKPFWFSFVTSTYLILKVYKAFATRLE